MDSFFEWMAIFQKFLNTLSWKKILQFTVFMFVIGLTWSAYETRESIYNFVKQSKLALHAPSSVRLSKRTIEEIKNSVDKSNLISGIQVTVVDFQKNTRTVIYTYSDDKNVDEINQRFSDSGLIDLPLFNSDVNNNRRMVDLINGEFICNPIQETIAGQLAPDITKYITTVCTTGIPPFYGKFTGIVGVYTRREPTPAEVDQLRNLVKTLSADIYDNDFK